MRHLCRFRQAALVGTSALLLTFFVATAVAAAATRYAAPSGSAGAACTQAAPCDLLTALTGSGVADGDSVLLEPGSYPQVTQTVQTDLNLNIHGLGTRPASTVVRVLGDFELLNPGASISNLALGTQGKYGLAFSGSVAENLQVFSSGDGVKACSIFHGTLADSVCLSSNASGISGSNAAVVVSSGVQSLQPVDVTLRNVTAYASGPNSSALLAIATSGQPDTIHLTNTILRDVGGYADIRSYTESGEPVSITADHSNYAVVQTGGPSVAVSPAGGGVGNQKSPPIFANEPALDLHEAAQSPTVNAGTANGVQAGELDAENNPRVQGSAPDIGAYEIQTGGTPPPPPAPQKPAASFSSSPGAPLARSSVSFDASGSTDPNAGGFISTYSWTFGDGAHASGQRVLHTYAHSGTYSVNLAVTDNLGQTSTTTRTVAVHNPSVPRVGLRRQQVKITAKGAFIKVSCGATGGRCAGSLTLTTTRKHVTFIHVHGKRVRHVSSQTIKLGSGGFSISAGHSQMVKIGLSQTVRRLIHSAGKHGLTVTASTRIGTRHASATVYLLG